MSTESIVYDPKQVTLEQARQSVEAFEAVVKAVLISGEDYGYTPGIEEPFLKQAGAQKLCSWFNISVDPSCQSPHEDWDKGIFGYRYKVRLWHAGNVIAACEAFCSNREEEFAFDWIEAPPPQSKDEEVAIQATNQARWRKVFGEWVWMQRIALDPYERVNQVMKRSQKRALVGAVLIYFAASGYFSRTQVEAGNYYDYNEEFVYGEKLSDGHQDGAPF